MTDPSPRRHVRLAWSNDEDTKFQLVELENLYHEAPVGLCFVDRKMRFLRINERLAQINGRSVEEHIGATVQEMIPDIADQMVPHYQRIIKTGRPVRNLQVRGILPSDPEVQHVWLVNHHPVKSSDGNVSGVMTVVQDVTAIKRVQTELERVKEHLARAQRVSGVGSWEWDIVEDRVWWSQELYRIFHQDPARFEPSLNGFFDLVYPYDRPKIRKQLDDTLEHGVPYAVTTRIQLFDGSLRTIEAHAVLERSPDGSPIRLIGTARDVTEQRPAAEPSAPRRR